MRGSRSHGGRHGEPSWVDLVPQASAPASPATGRSRFWVDSSGVVRRLPASGTQSYTQTTGQADPTAVEPDGSTYAQQTASPKVWVRVSSAWVVLASAAVIGLVFDSDLSGSSEGLSIIDDVSLVLT